MSFPYLTGEVGNIGISKIKNRLANVGIAWLLRDDFTDTRAAGSVNGTPATPGPGTRTVVDTGLKLSVTGGQLSFATGAGATGNPAIWYAGITRVAGLISITQVTITVATAAVQAGYHLAQGQITYSNGELVADIATIYATDGNLREVGAPLSISTSYLLAVVLRSTGAYYYVKGGAYANWTLLYIGTVGAEATLYPVVSNYSGVVTSDYVRIPVQTWLPTPICYDTFTRSNGALGSTEATGLDGQATPQLAWSNTAGSSAVSGNKIIATATDGAKAIASVTAPSADVLASMALTRGTGTPGIVFRYLNSTNYGYAVHDGTNAQLHKVVAGVDTTLVNIASSYAVGGVIRVICYGTKWRLYYNNQFRGTEQTVSDANLQSGVGVGWYTTDTDSTGDLFTVFARGTGGEYNAALDLYIA